MIEHWFSIRVVVFYVLIGIFAVIILLVIFKAAISSIAWKRKTRLLKKHGYNQFLLGVPSVGGGAFYGWRTENWDQFSERELERMSYKELKQKIKRNEQNDNGTDRK